MDKKIDTEKKFLPFSSFKQSEVDFIVNHLRKAGLSDDFIGKDCEERGWFYLNPNYKDNKEDKENDLKGKGKK